VPSSEPPRGAGIDAGGLVLVSVGTEQYPLDRLIDWMDAWLATEAGTRVDCLVQHGASKASSRARSRPFLPFDEMLATAGAASAIVCHGGTGTVMLARHAGIRPIVVPRRHRLGEHVDDHQVSFARRMAALGDVEVAESEQRLHDLLDGLVEGTFDPRSADVADGGRQAVAKFGRLMDELLLGRTR
jgi:UDP-N-acetylglucosamine transferase subunit ALG13